MYPNKRCYNLFSLTLNKFATVKFIVFEFEPINLVRLMIFIFYILIAQSQFKSDVKQNKHTGTQIHFV